MSDSENPSPPAAPEPLPIPIPPAPAAPRSQRNGCLTAFMVLVGVVLLLPGLCTMFFFHGAIGGLALLVALGGMALIAFAVLRTGR